MTSYGYRHVPNSQLQGIVERLNRPTKASRAWSHDYDAQQVHVEHLRSVDPYFHPKRTVTPKDLDDIVYRLQKRTRASTASTYGFDHQEASLIHLCAKDPKVQLGRSSRASSYTQTGSVRSSSIYSGNTDSALSSRKSRASITSSRSVASKETVNSQQLEEIVTRLTRPTVASRGGIDYADRNWDYIPTPKLKTLPYIPGLETRYKCKNRTMTQEEFDRMIGKLTRATKASQWKAAPNPH